MGKLTVKDDEGTPIYAGDSVSFSYGIPPVGVNASIIEDRGALWALTPGHTPDRCKLSVLKRYCGGFYKIKKPRHDAGFKVKGRAALEGET